MYARITRKCTLHSDWRMQSMLSTNRSSFRWNFTKYSIRLHAFIARLPQNANQHWWRGTEHTLVAQRRNNFSFSLFCINCTSNNEERCAKRKTFSCSPVLTPYAYCRKMETKEAETNADKKEKKGNENQRTRTVGLRRGKIEGINGKIAFSCVKEDFSNFIGLLLYIVGVCVCVSLLKRSLHITQTRTWACTNRVCDGIVRSHGECGILILCIKCFMKSNFGFAKWVCVLHTSRALVAHKTFDSTKWNQRNPQWQYARRRNDNAKINKSKSMTSAK